MDRNEDALKGMNYGYASDEVKQGAFRFGLNAGNTFLVKFEWIPNGGKEGKEQEALDIVFKIDGVEKGYRQFPVVKAFDKNRNEVTDKNSSEMKDAFKDFNSRITHILHCFREREQVQAALSRPIKDFKDFCNLAQGGLPKNFREIPLDIFMHYQWNISEGQTRTFLEIPKNMKQGLWLCAARPGNWKEVRTGCDDCSKALYYVNEKEEEHPFIRSGWFMNHNFANQQVEEGSESNRNNGTGATTAPESPATEESEAAGW